MRELKGCAAAGRMSASAACVFKRRVQGFAVTVWFALMPSVLVAQAVNADPASSSPAFVVADVHPSPQTMYPFARSTFAGDRFIMRQANLVDLIAKAYGVDPGNVTGGPNWMESEHFDIYAKAPAKSSAAAINSMLRGLLAERFHLVLHTGSKAMPAFVLSAPKGSGKLTEGDASVDPNCRYVDPPNAPPGTIQQIVFSCKNTTMEAFARNLHDWGGSYLPNPVVDATGLKGGYDFDLRWTGKGQLAKAGADGISIFDAVEKQLGLKLEGKTAPLPVVLVDSVERSPTPNVPDLAKRMPPAPPAEFEVATIRPSLPNETMTGHIQGNQVSLQAGTMNFMVSFAYDVTEEMLVNAPKWFETDRFDVLGKATAESPGGQPGAPQMDPDDLRLMMRTFLADRFKLVAHLEDRPLDAYTLIAVNPKLRRANPANRTGCKEGPGDDGKDPRNTTPILGRLLTCRNMTMAQFAAMLQSQASGYIHTPVLDATGLDGAYDITLSFSAIQQMPSGPPASGAGTDASAASEPSGALSFLDAINKELGLKLIKSKRPVPSLVIDHVEEKPTEN